MIRLANDSDFEIIEKIGTSNHSNDYYEGAESFFSKIKGCPEGCFVYIFDKKIVGYVISFPYVFEKSYPINSFYQKTENPNCYYIHDLCIDKPYRKMGFAKKLVEKVLEINFNPKTLTAVQNSENFWRSVGFEILKEVEYCGKKAYYMII